MAGLSQDAAQISIHAPREGSDPAGAFEAVAWLRFLSTLPARGATHSMPAGCHRPNNFYPRSPRGERRRAPIVYLRSKDFYPRSPRGERLALLMVAIALFRFLSTLPARGATWTR